MLTLIRDAFFTVLTAQETIWPGGVSGRGVIVMVTVGPGTGIVTVTVGVTGGYWGGSAATALPPAIRENARPETASAITTLMMATIAAGL